MFLREDNYIENINAYTVDDWKPLLDIMEEIEATESFGETVGGGIDEDGDYVLPNWASSMVVYDFLDIVYKIPIIIDFDWPGWNEGRKIISDESFDYDSIDIPTKCKLISAIARNERFCDGVLSGYFEKGVMQKILKSIKKQLGC